MTTDGQIRLEEMAVADLAILTKANDGALICPALRLWVLDEDRLTCIKNWMLLAVLFGSG